MSYVKGGGATTGSPQDLERVVDVRICGPIRIGEQIDPRQNACLLRRQSLIGTSTGGLQSSLVLFAAWRKSCADTNKHRLKISLSGFSKPYVLYRT